MLVVSVAHSFTQFRIILGDFDFSEIEEADSVLGPIYFTTFVFFIFMILLVNTTRGTWHKSINLKFKNANVLLGLMFCSEYVLGHHQRHVLWGESWHGPAEVRDGDHRPHQEGLQQSDGQTQAEEDLHQWHPRQFTPGCRQTQLWWAPAGPQRVRNIYPHCMIQMKPLQLSVWTVLYAFVHRKGHSDAEIEAIFAKYDLDGDQELTEHEHQQMRDDLEKERVSEKLMLQDVA